MDDDPDIDAVVIVGEDRDPSNQVARTLSAWSITSNTTITALTALGAY